MVLACLVPPTSLLLKINNLYYNKLKYLTKDFNSLSIKIEKELWENEPYMLENKKRSLLIFLFDDLRANVCRRNHFITWIS